MKIGEYNDLRINRMVDFGAYLIDDDTHEVLLPKRYLTPEMKVGDQIRVFVYNDSENRPVATTEKPYAVVGDFGSAATVAELYRARWQVELLFKELKQTLQLKDFYGENEKAVAWQVWTAMLVHLLLRYLAYASSWKGSHTRFAGVVRAALWERTDLMGLLETYGTAPPPSGSGWDGNTPCLPGFERYCARAMG